VKTSFLPFSLTISHGFHAKSRDPTLFDQVSEKSQRVDFVTAAHSTEALASPGDTAGMGKAPFFEAKYILNIYGEL
jgi:hypothetical protein